jgi:hypothetical protein
MPRVLKLLNFILISILSILFVAYNINAATLNWNHSSNDPVGYKVYYGTNKSSLSDYKDVGYRTTYNIDQLPLSESVQYFLSVSAYNRYGESEPCPPVGYIPGDTTPPLPPKDLLVSIQDNSSSLYTAESQNSGLAISNLYAMSGKAYKIQEDIQNGRDVYIDKKYTAFQNIPTGLKGSTYIMTANDDNNLHSLEFISFDVNRDVVVYLAHDDRITQGPKWFTSSFTDTGENLKTNVTMSIYKRSFPKGKVTLGGNGTDTAHHYMYSIIVR